MRKLVYQIIDKKGKILETTPIYEKAKTVAKEVKGTYKTILEEYKEK